MRIQLTAGALLAAFVVMTGVAVAAPPERVNLELNTPGTQKTLMLLIAADHSPVISLGTAVDPTSGKVVEGYAIVHYAKGGGGSKGGSTALYSLMAKGAKWKTVEPWLINPQNNGGLPQTGFELTNMSADIAKWEDATDGILGNSMAGNILGDGSETTANLVADTVSPDGTNEVYFASIADPGAIAVTIVWGVFGGPVGDRELLEWDQVFDDADYAWSTSGEAGKMDFENIATHELGHSIGLNDLYSLGASEQTMYGYADFGETKKQSLESGDIAGTNVLY